MLGLGIKLLSIPARGGRQLRCYTQLGFLNAEALTKGGYWLYKKEPTFKALVKIAALVKKGHTLEEIKNIKKQQNKSKVSAHIRVTKHFC